MDSDDLTRLREQMDLVNLELREVLIRRFELAEKILACKHRRGRQAKDKDREDAILRRMLEDVADPPTREYLERVFKAVFPA